MALIQGDIFIHASRCHGLFQSAIQLFEEYLQEKLSPKAPEYYRARNFLKEGKALYEDILQRAKLLLGPAPPYSPPDFEKQRAQILAENKIIIHCQRHEEILDELVRDDLLTTMMTAQEIGSYLKGHFQSQGQGKRKLANIKVRMIIDKLKEMKAKGLELQQRAQQYYQKGENSGAS
jgi:hypothetical protein